MKEANLIPVYNYETINKMMANIYSIRAEQINHNPLIITFTGHIGEGKNYVASIVENYILDDGFNVFRTAFASPLKKLVYNSFKLRKNLSENEEYSTQYEAIFNYNDFVNNVGELYHIIPANKRTLSIQEFVERIYHKIVPELKNFVESKEFKEASLKIKVRKTFQNVGSLVRKYIQPNFWALIACEYINRAISENICDYAIISDLRYLNEYDELRQTFKNQLLVVRVKCDIDIICKRNNIDKKTYLELIKHESEKEIDSIPVNIVYNNNQL